MNRETRERIQYLLMQWLERRESPGEAADLSRLLTGLDVADEDWLDIMEELMLAEPPMAGYDSGAWRPFIDRILAEAADTEVKTVPVVRVPWRRWMAAASVVLALGIGVWMLVERQQKGGRSVETDTNGLVRDVAAPVRSKATITLAGGQKVALDSVVGKDVAEQGGAKIEKGAGGQVAYRMELGARSALLYNTLSNPRGSRVVNLTLSDGTRVWLNAESSIRYPAVFVGSDRTVEVSGEAYFEVAADAVRPFRVKKDSATIEFLGTAFDVNAYRDEPTLKVTLLNGKVGVAEGGERVLLGPGQQAVVRESVRLAGVVDTAAVMAWKNGNFAFADADLPAVMRQLARWYDLDVSYAGAVPAGHFEGKIGTSLTLDQVLRLLTRAQVHYRIEAGHKLIIEP